MALSSVLRQVENSIKKNQLVHYLINPLLIFLIFSLRLLPALFASFLSLRFFVLFFMGIIYLSTNIESYWGSISARFPARISLPVHPGFTQQYSPCARNKSLLYIKATSHYGNFSRAIAPDKDRLPWQKRLSLLHLLQQFNKTDAFYLSRTVTRPLKGWPHYFARNAVHFSTSRSGYYA
jgi:hypothetical protein